MRRCERGKGRRYEGETGGENKRLKMVKIEKRGEMVLWIFVEFDTMCRRF